MNWCCNNSPLHITPPDINRFLAGLISSHNLPALFDVIFLIKVAYRIKIFIAKIYYLSTNLSITLQGIINHFLRFTYLCLYVDQRKLAYKKEAAIWQPL